MVPSSEFPGDETQKAVLLLTEQDNEKTISVQAGDVFDVMLEANITTGYSWHVDAVDAEILKVVSSGYRANPVPDGWVGGGGTRTMRFKALHAGQAGIKLVYRRPWEDKEPERTFEVTIGVNEPD